MPAHVLNPTAQQDFVFIAVTDKCTTIRRETTAKKAAHRIFSLNSRFITYLKCETCQGGETGRRARLRI